MNRMTRIDARRLQFLLQNHNYRRMAVRASPLGGWYVERPDVQMKRRKEFLGETK